MTATDETRTPPGGIALLYEAVKQKGWATERPEFRPPTPIPVEHRDEAYSKKAASWCGKALEGKCTALAAMEPDSGRNNALNAAGLQLYRYVLAGHLDGEDVTERLRHAALDCGLSNGEIEATLASAQRGAEKYGPQEPPLDPPEPLEGAPGEGAVDETTGEVLTPEQMAERAHQRRVREELALLRARDEAKRLFVAERAALEFREPPSVMTLREQLLLPREPTKYSVEEVLPFGGNVLSTAQYKAGKTTLNTAFLKSYADEVPFLGRFAVTPHAGRIAIFNYELSQQQYDQWLEESGIIHTDRISVLHLRGYRLDIRVPRIEDWVVAWLKDHDVSTWIADPFARAAVGVDENSNTDVGVWLDTFDIIKERAGVIDGVLTTHTGRAEQESGQERARGATRLDDWADVRWLLTKDDQGNRYFRATGRDVEVAEEKLTFDPLTRALTIGGGDREWVKRRVFEDAVLAFVKSTPGCSGATIESGVEGKSASIRQGIKDALRNHRMRVEDGAGTAKAYYSNE